MQHTPIAPMDEEKRRAVFAVECPGLVIHLRDTAVFCQMLTGRFRLATGLISRKLKLRRDRRPFLRMNTLFSVDARPPGAYQAPLHVQRA
jgi:hypothetical protein